MWAQPSEQHTGPWRHEGHAQRPDTRPIEDPADKSKILLAKQGASTHANHWLATLVMRKPKMVAAVALANKMARMIWALTTKEQDYRMA